MNRYFRRFSSTMRSEDLLLAVLELLDLAIVIPFEIQNIVTLEPNIDVGLLGIGEVVVGETLLHLDVPSTIEVVIVSVVHRADAVPCIISELANEDVATAILVLAWSMPHTLLVVASMPTTIGPSGKAEAIFLA